MLSVDWSQILEEYAEEGVGELMYSFIHHIVQTICIDYPESIYAPHGVWDEGAIDDICQDFTLNKLIQPGNLDHHLYASENILQFGAMVKRDFRHFLINRAHRTAFQQIRKRVLALLETDQEFQSSAGHGDETIWYVEGQSAFEIEQSLESVLHTMWQIQLPPTIRYRVDSAKRSPLIANDDLKRLLRETFIRIGKGITFSLIMEAVRYRLNLHDDEIVSLDDPIAAYDEDMRTVAETVEDPAPEVEAQVEAMEIAVHLIERLTERQRKVLASYLGLLNSNQTAIAQQLRVSIGTVNQEIQTIIKYVRTVCTTSDAADSVMQQLAKLLADEQL